MNFRYPILLFSLTLTLYACSTGSKKSVDDVISEAVKNQAGVTEQDDGETPEYYIRLASETEGEERQQYLLRAAELLIKRGDVSLAEDQLQNLNPDQLEGKKQGQIKLLAARIALANNNPEQAIELIPPRQELSHNQALEASSITADAYFKMGYYMRVVETRVVIEQMLETDALKQENHNAIWLALSSMPGVELSQQHSSDREIQGWLELARIMRHGQTSINTLQENILDWGTEYTGHPVSNRFIDSIIDAYLENRQSTGTIAIMLPLTGEYSNVGNAVQSGFLTAHYSNSINDSGGIAPRLKFYDTGKPEQDFDSLYQRALLEGATTIIGPLEKPAINRMAQRDELEVPVLTLNYAENPLSSADNLYQFGLLPEDEARQAAELAIRDDRKRAVVLAPATAWGKRLTEAFSNRFAELGGKVVASQQFDKTADDFNKPIQRLFKIDSSERRRRDLQRLLNIKLKFTPYRRQDVDMIFLAATHRSARGIMPAFKFQYAGDLPVYATSHVYTGKHDQKSDRDLDGLMFCDIPWTLTSDDSARRQFDDYWPEQQVYTRLFAMGVDAYYLVRNLTYLQSNSYARFPGETGNLYMDEYGRIHRELIWARFKRGIPVYMDIHSDPAAVTEGAIENDT